MPMLLVIGEDGHTRRVDPSDVRLLDCGLQHRSYVSTTRGDGTVLGVGEDEQLYIQLNDAHSKGDVIHGIGIPLRDVRAGREVVIISSAPVDNSAEAAEFIFHRLKRLNFCGKSITIATQSRNGPCPVLALANALALEERVLLCSEKGGDGGWISAEQLRHVVASYLWQRPPPPSFAPSSPLLRSTATTITRRSKTEGDGNSFSRDPSDAISPSPIDASTTPAAAQRTLAGLVQDARAFEQAREKLLGHALGTTEQLLKRLYHGMDVDPIFSDVDGFTEEGDVLLFAAGGIPLLHGWLINDDGPFAPLRECSFNEVATLAVSSPGVSPPAPNFSTIQPDTSNSNDGTPLPASPLVLEALAPLAKSFYLSTMNTQMTVEGLCALHHHLHEGSVAVLFWRNHFFTVVKLQDQLLALCSNEHFADKSAFVFSAIRDVENCESVFVDGCGRTIDPMVAHIQARCGNEFSTRRILAAVERLREKVGPNLTTEQVLEFLVSAAHGTTEAIVGGGGGGGERPATAHYDAASSVVSRRPHTHHSNDAHHHRRGEAMEIAAVVEQQVQQMRDIIPDLPDDQARHFLLEHGDVRRAIEAYFSSISSNIT